MTMFKCDKSILRKMKGVDGDKDGGEIKELMNMWDPKIKALESEAKNTGNILSINRKAMQLEKEFEAWNDRKYPKSWNFISDDLADAGQELRDRIYMLQD